MSLFSLPKISPVTPVLRDQIRVKINTKTKPLGSLGALESVAQQIAEIQNTMTPKLQNPKLILFAGDHGITEEPVSLYPKDVTWQMVFNFLRGGACANVFAKHSDIDVEVVDAGVDHDWDDATNQLIQIKIRNGTSNFLKTSAMTKEEASQSLQNGINLISDKKYNDTNVFLFGEMGIGNTSSASLILSHLTGIPLSKLVGKGTGLNPEGKNIKLQILEKAYQRTGKLSDPLEILSEFGGFEIGMMAGAMLGAASKQNLFIVDGFITTAAYLIAHHLSPTVKDYAIFSHVSDEEGHIIVLNHYQIRPLLTLNLRLGEGSGALAAYPLIELSVKFLNEMASFADAGVSDSDSKA
ncbi:nicotinate-nucleotide--dimethylbenzimidazole phosphoribosyltransferase [Leptospira bouyouniensis]|uniref:nicotinate-nucleotide--dimethylbenzimidazole phosphoribosyltransferase n=1 Tax=Leptospira bouyouniensis TaxID=2484911 RepID=UPI001090FE53|nr:nicotinate-nucleotide--dimethylbenzimidazole phosphoribosyltransferase [Leptospira bouyouniensis]TGM87819.1 nicotinate-nucleotide--dimethylbenzimidazole phosphoribosyltransferase [Leptospira bouyouniensis]